MLRVISALVYSHVWIALCACAMVAQTFHIYRYDWIQQPLVWLTLGGTLFTYSIHRIVGLNKLQELNYQLNPRYLKIESGRKSVLIFGVSGAIIAAYSFFLITRTTQLFLVIPGLISILYVSPILGNRRRLRDFGMLKIFLIALTYAFVCVMLVKKEVGEAIEGNTFLLLVEKAIFILAITIPFDIRDLDIDKLGTAKTIPMMLGQRKSVMLAIALTLLALASVWFNPIYLSNQSTVLTVSYLLTAGLIFMVKSSRSDLYYSFGLDGTMLLQSLAIILLT